MKKFESKDLGVSFTLPDKMTARQQLVFRRKTAGFVEADDLYIRYWEAAVELVQDWECEKLPDPAAFDLDAEVAADVVDIVMYAANVTAGHFFSIGEVDPNS